MRYCIEEMGNGLTFVRDRRSGLIACYGTARGVYRFGDLRAPTLSLLLAWGDERAQWMAWYDQVTAYGAVAISIEDALVQVEALRRAAQPQRVTRILEEDTPTIIEEDMPMRSEAGTTTDNTDAPAIPVQGVTGTIKETAPLTTAPHTRQRPIARTRRLRRWLAFIVLGMAWRFFLVVGLWFLAFSITSYVTQPGGRDHSLLDLSIPGMDIGVDLQYAVIDRAGAITIWVYPVDYGDFVVLLKMPGGPPEPRPPGDRPAPPSIEVPRWRSV